ncbi:MULTISPECIES: cupin domain-containing protein [Haloferax]|uniref:Cupin domain-containing protein n=2 Tax=Haloferax TaxID=2251 RepID=A0A6G1YYM5_9EURY|nr:MULTISPECIES: cupin domain-containing protein [Haloferax]KAB1186803.1 cupin domain-containing protein [Haloferax sp. CBA1149]MRW79429.1 cupin domain-containing protein [Haloferax marinisediminis]
MDLPRTITSPVTGGRREFLKLPEETDGAYLQFETTLQAQTPGPPMHYHPTATEQFEIRAGSLYVTIDGDDDVLGRGKTVVVPARTPHTFRIGPLGVRIIVTVTPPGRFAEFLVSEYALMHAGKLENWSDGDILAVAPWLHEFRDVTRPASPIQYVIWMLAPVGRAFGNPPVPAYPVGDERETGETAETAE